MRLLAVLLLAAAASLPGSAYAAPGPPAGERCGFDAVSEPGPADGVYSGVVYGGPLAAPGAAVTITCSLKVTQGRHGDAALVTETAGPGPGVVVLEPRRMSYVVEGWETTYVCTAATVDGAAWYWDGAAGAWSPDPAASCETTPTTRVPPDVHTCLACLLEMADAYACPVLATLPSVPGVVGVEEHGDVDVAGERVWDCPPYEAG